MKAKSLNIWVPTYKQIQEGSYTFVYGCNTGEMILSAKEKVDRHDWAPTGRVHIISTASNGEMKGKVEFKPAERSEAVIKIKKLEPDQLQMKELFPDD